MPASVLDRCCDVEEAGAVREALGELNSYATGDKPGPFGKAGWLRELFRWAEEQVAPLGIRLTGNFRQLNASPTFSLIRLETNSVALWFKATGKPNEHELAVALSLARLFPRYVPRVLGKGGNLDRTETCRIGGDSSPNTESRASPSTTVCPNLDRRTIPKRCWTFARQYNS